MSLIDVVDSVPLDLRVTILERVECLIQPWRGSGPIGQCRHPVVVGCPGVGRWHDEASYCLKTACGGGGHNPTLWPTRAVGEAGRQPRGLSLGASSNGPPSRFSRSYSASTSGT